MKLGRISHEEVPASWRGQAPLQASEEQDDDAVSESALGPRYEGTEFDSRQSKKERAIDSLM